MGVIVVITNANSGDECDAEIVGLCEYECERGRA